MNEIGKRKKLYYIDTHPDEENLELLKKDWNFEMKNVILDNDKFMDMMPRKKGVSQWTGFTIMVSFILPNIILFTFFFRKILNIFRV